VPFGNRLKYGRALFPPLFVFMKRFLLLLVTLCLICVKSFTQSTVPIRGDTIRMYKQGDTAVAKVDSILFVTMQAVIGKNYLSLNASVSLDLRDTTRAFKTNSPYSRIRIATPIDGMIIYEDSTEQFLGYVDGAWTPFGGGSPGSGDNIYNTSDRIIADRYLSGNNTFGLTFDSLTYFQFGETSANYFRFTKAGVGLNGADVSALFDDGSAFSSTYLHDKKGFQLFAGNYTTLSGLVKSRVAPGGVFGDASFTSFEHSSNTGEVTVLFLTGANGEEQDVAIIDFEATIGTTSYSRAHIGDSLDTTFPFPGVYLQTKSSAGGTYKGIFVALNSDVDLQNYPSTRNDGNSQKALYIGNADGSIKYGYLDTTFYATQYDLTLIGGTQGLEDVIIEDPTLTANRDILVGTNILTVEGSGGVGVPVFGVSNSSTGIALYAENTGGGLTAQYELHHSSTNTNRDIVDWYRLTTGTAAAGLGQKHRYLLEVTSGGSSVASSMNIIWEDPTAGAATANVVWNVLSAGSELNALSLIAGAQIQFNTYTGTNFNTAQAKVAMVGTDGKIYAVDTTGLFGGGGNIIDDLQATLTAGATVTTNHTIAVGANTLDITGSGSGAHFQVTHSTGAGQAILGLNNGTGAGVEGRAVSSYGVISRVGNSTTNTYTALTQHILFTSATPTAGIGGYESYYMPVAANSSQEFARFAIKVTDVTSSSEDGDVELWGRRAGTITRQSAFLSTGQQVLPAYTTTTSFTVTPVGMLVFDAAGNIGTQAISGGSYTDEQAQDAVGAMINASLQYVDGTPLLAIGDRDFGDITTSGSGLTMIIDDAAVQVNDIDATGTPDGTTFLRGDGTWSTPAGSGIILAGVTGKPAYYTGATQLDDFIAVDYAASGNLVTLTHQNTTDVAFLFQGISSQSGNFITIKNSGGTTIFEQNKDARLRWSQAATAANPHIQFSTGGATMFDHGGYNINYGTANDSWAGSLFAGGVIFNKFSSVAGIYISTDVGNGIFTDAIRNVRDTVWDFGYNQAATRPGETEIFKLFDGAGTDQAAGNFIFQTSAGTGNSAINGDFIWQTPDAGSTGATVQSFTEKMRLTRIGQLKLVNYTTTTSFTGTPVGALGFDANGNILTMALGGGSGEANTASNLGGGLANWDSKSGVDLRFNTFASADFDLASNLITIDATKWLTISAAAAAYQPLDADLTIWAGITPGTNVGAFLATPSSANLRAALTDENGTGVALFNAATSPGFTTAINPISDDGATLGTVSLRWSDLFLASGAVINFNGGNVVLTHSTGILTMGTGDLRVTNAGTNAASVVTLAGTQTLTNKSIDASQLTGSVATARLTNIKQAKSLSLQSPTTSENVALFYTTEAITVTNVREALTGSSPSVTYVLRYGSSSRATSTADIVSSHAATSTAGANATLTANVNIPAGSYIWIETSATGGTVSEINVTVTYNQQ
jgi:hypothetical protein